MPVALELPDPAGAAAPVGVVELPMEPIGEVIVLDSFLLEDKMELSGSK